MGPLKSSNTARERPSVGATLVTEQLTFQQAGRNGGAIHLHKWAARSIAAIVNGFCNQLLASSCFPLDQYGGVGRGHDVH